jgi:hypothetical protein
MVLGGLYALAQAKNALYVRPCLSRVFHRNVTIVTLDHVVPF